MKNERFILRRISIIQELDRLLRAETAKIEREVEYLKNYDPKIYSFDIFHEGLRSADLLKEIQYTLKSLK